MKSVTAVLAALVLVLGVGLLAGVPAGVQPAVAAGYHPVPEATKKKKPPKATPTPTNVTPSPVPTPRRPVDEEGDRWVQLAMIGGGGLLACVLAFFGIGALMRRRPR